MYGFCFQPCVYTASIYNFSWLYLLADPLGYPAQVSNISLSYREDERPGFAGYSVVNVSWKKPKGVCVNL